MKWSITPVVVAAWFALAYAGFLMNQAVRIDCANGAVSDDVCSRAGYFMLAPKYDWELNHGFLAWYLSFVSFSGFGFYPNIGIIGLSMFYALMVMDRLKSRRESKGTT